MHTDSCFPDTSTNFEITGDLAQISSYAYHTVIMSASLGVQASWQLSNIISSSSAISTTALGT
jgi:hypothetical protein